MLKNGRGGKGKARVCQHQMIAGQTAKRCQPFPNALGNGRAAQQAERHIRTQAQAKRCQLRRGKSQRKSIIRRQQHCRGVAGPPRQPSSQGDFFFYLNLQTKVQSAGCF